MKTCRKCSEKKPIECFSRDSRAKDGRQSWCKSCNSKAWAARPPKTPEQRRRNKLMTRYRITVERYDEILVEQGGVCAICGQAPSERKRLAVDHCHGTNGVRGLLCDPCNRGVGCFDDNPERLRSAVAYLESSEGSGRGT